MPLMAQRIVTEVTDDTNGKPADETVTFGLDGREYEIDLTSKNAAALRKAFDVYVKSGRRIGGRRPPSTGGAGVPPPRRGQGTEGRLNLGGKKRVPGSGRGRCPGAV